MSKAQTIDRNIAFDWFSRFGMGVHDSRTVRNVTSADFIVHAKSVADAEESAYIDRCVEFQNSTLGK